MQLINERDVVRLKIPFPNMTSALAYSSHMYICYEKSDSVQRLVKCQTYKLSVIMGINAIKHYVKELPDIKRNPFKNATIIDCDKSFAVQVVIPNSLLTTTRRDICSELHVSILDELLEDGYCEYELDNQDLQTLNYAIETNNPA